MSIRPPYYAPVANDFFAITASCATSASAIAAGVGPFAGIFFRTTTSLTVISFSGNSMKIDAEKNSFIWISGAYVSAIATATCQFGVL